MKILILYTSTIIYSSSEEIIYVEKLFQYIKKKVLHNNSLVTFYPQFQIIFVKNLNYNEIQL